MKIVEMKSKPSLPPPPVKTIPEKSKFQLKVTVEEWFLCWAIQAKINNTGVKRRERGKGKIAIRWRKKQNGVQWENIRMSWTNLRLKQTNKEEEKKK